MIVTTSRKRVNYKDYMASPRLQQQVWNTMDHNMALGLFAFLFREDRELDNRWVRLHRSFEFMTRDDDPEYLHIHGEVSLDLSAGEDGGDIE
jgi:hypothetical protein